MKTTCWNDVDAAARIWGGGRSASDPSPRLLESIFGGKSIKTPSEKTQKKLPTNMKNHAEKVTKWSRYGTKTNENSIQTQVMGNIMKIIKNHVSLNGMIIEIHC